MIPPFPCEIYVYLDSFSDLDLTLVCGTCLETIHFFSEISILLHKCFFSRISWFLEFPISVVVSPFSFLIWLIWILPLGHLVILATGSSMLFIISNNQVLVLLIHCLVLFVSILIISALCFTIFFRLFLLIEFAFLFSRPLKCPVKVQVPHKFGYDVSTFS